MVLYVHRNHNKEYLHLWCFTSTETTIKSIFIHGALRPQKPYDLLGTEGKQWDKE